jgi:hypothetical protein
MDWQGAKDLPFGSHTIRIVARDLIGNETVVDVPVEKVSERRLATLSARPVRVERIRVGGRGLQRRFFGKVAVDQPFAVPGKVMVQWQKKRGRKWKTIHKGFKNANKPFRVSQRLRYAGVWRARAIYQGKKPFRRASSCWVVFSTAKKGSRQTCPRGLRAQRKRR